MTLTAIIVMILGFVISVKCNDHLWFQRFGSILVGIGIVLLARTFITRVDIKTPILGEHTRLNIFEKEHYKIIGEEVPDFVKTDIESRKAIGLYGPLISFIGTLIWGFGDLFIAYFLN